MYLNQLISYCILIFQELLCRKQISYKELNNVWKKKKQKQACNN